MAQPQKKSITLMGIVLTAVLLTGGAVHGYFSDRWGVPEGVRERAHLVTTLPLEIGRWKGVENPLDPRQLKIAGAIDHISRQYTHQDTGETVSIYVLAGRPGPISLHEPTVCFTSSGMRQITPLLRGPLVKSANTSLNVCRTIFRGALEQHSGLLTSWTWSTDGTNWEAPQNPRLEFSGKPILYKLYVMVPTKSNKADDELTATVTEFVQQLESELSTTLTAGSAG